MLQKLQMRKYSIAVRISVILVVTILAGVGISAAQIWSLRQTVYAEREQKLRDMVGGVLKLIKTYDEEVTAGHLSLHEAQERVKQATRAIRWGHGEYFGVYQTDGLTLAHANAKYEGLYRMDSADPNGRRTVAELITAAKAGGGLVRYMVPRGTTAEGDQEAIAKMAYAAQYEPWKWVVQTGVYINDIDDTLWRQSLWIGGLEFAVLLAAGLLGLWIALSISRPVAELVSAIDAIDPAQPGSWRRPSQEHDELGQIVRSLDALMQAFQLGLEQRDRARNESVRLGAELDVSRRMQQILLPSLAELAAIEGLEIAAFMEPASEVGGDYYDILRHAGGVRIGIGDVTGHGLESGMIMLMTQSAVRTLLTNRGGTLVSELNAINTTIYENVKRMGCGKNLSLALLEYSVVEAGLDATAPVAKGQLRMSGQHEYVIIARTDGRIETIDTDSLGFPIGLVADVTEFVADLTLPLYSGDVVVLYTDGITEAADEQHRLYGLERLAAMASASRTLSAEAIKAAIVSDVKQHMGRAVLFDDLTLVVLKQL